MPRWLRISLRVVIGLVLLIVLLWIGLVWYINANKNQLLKQLTETLSEKTGGELMIRDITPSLWKSFPNISVALQDISLRDSLYAEHKHSLLEAKSLYVRLNTFELLSKRVEIQKVTATHGSIYLYTDSNGYSNSYLLSSKDTTSEKKKKKETIFKSFALEDIQFFLVHKIKQKLFHIHIQELDGSTMLDGSLWKMHINTDAHVNQFCFNTVRGSYLKDKDLDINFDITYDPKLKKLLIPEQELRISGEPIRIKAVFNFLEKPSDFELTLQSNSIPYKTAVSWVSQNIAKKLDSFDFKKPVAVDVKIKGVMAYKNIPTIKVSYKIEKNTLMTKMGDVDDVNFTGFYFNEAVAGMGHGDNNSLLQFQQVTGSWNAIPFQMDTLRIVNLLVPYLDARIKSKFPLTAINDAVGGNSFSFTKGTAEADFRYLGGVVAQDTTPYTINGFVKVSDAYMSYLPRSLNFNSVRATLVFKEDNLFLRDVHLASKSSAITMEGEALHFLQLYFTDPEKIILTWRAKSPKINLNDFTSFIGQRKSGPASTTPKPASTRIGNQIDRVLDLSSIYLDANIDQLIYKNFAANTVTAKAALSQSGIKIEEAGLQHSGGSMKINGVIRQEAKNNPFDITAIFDNVDVAAIFKSFDNFGQQAIEGENLKGRLNANAKIQGQMTEGGKIIPKSMNGSVDFKLVDGELNNFSPLEKIGKFIFKKRNLSHVTFKSLQNKLSIEPGKIVIPPMKIETSAVNIDVVGVYGIPTGTDIFMSIPLRNPEKEEANTLVGQLWRKGNGIVINLRAQDGDKDGVKIGWDPFKKGKKATADIDSTQKSRR